MAKEASKKVKLLGVDISRLGMLETLEACKAMIKSDQGGYVCFANVHTVTESAENHALQNALNQATLSVADGLPLVWASRVKKQPIGSRVCGPDFMRMALKELRDEVHGFIGGAPGSAKTIADRFGIKAIFYNSPVRPFSEQNAVEDWKTFLELCPGGVPPSIVWIGLGAPKQELWMSTVTKMAPKTLFFGVGAAFDFLSGRKNRAPLWMQKTGLEWFYRFSQEPGRLWKRYLATNSRFLLHLALDLLRPAR